MYIDPGLRRKYSKHADCQTGRSRLFLALSLNFLTLWLCLSAATYWLHGYIIMTVLCSKASAS